MQVPQKCSGVLRGHIGAVHVAKYNTEGQYILSGGQDKLIKLWNASSQTPVATYSGHGREILDIDVSEDNSRLVSCGGDKAVFLWDVGSVKITRKLKGHDQRVNCVAFNVDATVVVSGSYDSSLRFWDLRSSAGGNLQVVQDAKDSISSLEIHDCQILTGSVDGSVRLYDIRMGRMVQDNITFPVTFVSFSNDKNCILASSLDDTIRLLDRDSGELLNDYSGHTNNQYKVASCLDNTDAFVLSGSEDNAIYVWDLVDASVVAKIQGHTNVITGLAYHPKTPQFLSASVDGTVRIWEI